MKGRGRLPKKREVPSRKRPKRQHLTEPKFAAAEAFPVTIWRVTLPERLRVPPISPRTPNTWRIFGG
jgi:hypothetical protein